MNQSILQRENLRKVNGVTKGENVQPLTSSNTKPLGLSSKGSNVFNNNLKMRQETSTKRSFLGDKNSNLEPLQSKGLQNKNRKEFNVPVTKVYVDENTLKAEDTLEIQKKSEEDASLIQDFFNDNQTRYLEDEEDFCDIVPILPIVVPDRIKQMYFKDKLGFEQNQNWNELKNQKESNDENDIISTRDRSTVQPPLIFQLDEQTIQLEHEHESRAKMAMSLTSQTLKEGQWNDPMLVAEYAGEIFSYLYDTELSMMASPHYANSQQHEVTWKMRSVLIDWIIEIHYLFGLLPETLFLAVNIIDRFLSLRTVALGKIQLVGITALFIATKFEEILCPTMQDFLYMTDNAVTEHDLIKAERFILQNLDFRLCYPNPLNFLRRICADELHYDVHTRTLAKYFMEITCIDHRFITVRPSKIAAAALWLSRKMLVKGKWTSSFTKMAGYSPEELKPVVETMLDYLAQPLTHDAFFKKWSSKKLSKASIFVRDWINRYYLDK